MYTSPAREQPKPYRGVHPEDVKAAIRKKYGTIRNFHKQNQLPVTGLFDVLRGRASQRVQDAMDAVLGFAPDSTNLDVSETAAATHRLNSQAQ